MPFHFELGSKEEGLILSNRVLNGDSDFVPINFSTFPRFPLLFCLNFSQVPNRIF